MRCTCDTLLKRSRWCARALLEKAAKSRKAITRPGVAAARSSYPYHNIFTPHLSIVSSSVLIQTDSKSVMIVGRYIDYCYIPTNIQTN